MKRSLSKVLRIVVEGGYHEGQKARHCCSVTGCRKRVAHFLDPGYRRDYILPEVLQVAEEDSGQTSRRIDLHGPEYRDSRGLTVGAAIVAQEEEGSIVAHAAPVDRVGLAEEGPPKVEEERSWYAKDAGWLRTSCRRTAGASLTAADDLRRESLAVADASRTAGLRQNAVGHHTADHPVAVGASHRTDSGPIGAVNHAASAGLARACCKNAIQWQVVLMELKD